MWKFWQTIAVVFVSKKLQAAVSCQCEMNSTVDIFLRTFEDKNNFLNFVSKLSKIIFHICVALKRTVFFVCSVCYSLSVNGNFKETFGMFLLLFNFEHFHTAAFFSSRKMATGIFSYLSWYHSPQTEQNAMKNPLSSFGSSSKNGTRHLQYNGKRCVTSFPRLTRFVCYENGVIVSFSNCANKCFLITLWL